MCIQHSLSKNVCTAGRLNCTQTLHHLVDYLFVCDRILACPFNEQIFLILIFFFIFSNSMLAVLESKRTYKALLLKLTVCLAMWLKESP